MDFFRLKDIFLVELEISILRLYLLLIRILHPAFANWTWLVWPDQPSSILRSLEFFLTLWHVLGRTGTLSIIINNPAAIRSCIKCMTGGGGSADWERAKARSLVGGVIRLSSESWDTILNYYSKYFNNTYGEKIIAFQKLSDIRRLTSNKSDLFPSLLLHTLFMTFQQME